MKSVTTFRKVGIAIPFVIATLLLTQLTSCIGGGSIHGNNNGSEPINEGEVVEYKKAVVRCHKTGGTRIVKINGLLRCF